jgi:hypothetical protein
VKRRFYHHRGITPTPEYVSFWLKVSPEYSGANGKNELGCWIFTGGKRDGYGLFKSRDGVSHNAHRYAWETIVGPVPAILQVLHRCDNPVCVNPRHLFLGTIQDNMDDRNAKNRHAFGERTGTATMTNAIAKEVLSLKPSSGRAPRGFLGEVAKQYGTSKQVVSLLWRRKTWRHL